MGGFPLFTTHLRAKIRGQNFLWGSKGGSAPLKEKNGTHGMLSFFGPIFGPIFSSHIDNSV